MMSTSKQIAIAAASIIGLLAGSSPAAAQCDAEAVINCGHRGTGVNESANGFAENAIASFAEAEREGASMIELDVVHSSDGVLVVIHDDTVDRTTDGSGCVGNMTLVQLQALDAGAGTAMEGTGVVIPTLAEALAAITVDVNIELKINDTGSCPDSNKPLMAADVVSAIQTDTKDRRIIVSSFDEVVLAEIKSIDAGVYAGFLTLDPADAAMAASMGFDALNVLSLSTREQATIDQIHAMGLDVNVWTENDQFNMDDRLAAGVDMIITDDPALLETVRAAYCERTEGGGGGCRAGQGGASGAVASLALLGLWCGRRRRKS